MPAWAPGSWAADAWAGTAWDETAPTIGTAWFANAWAPGAWGSAAWASASPPPPPPPSPWDLDVPTLGPQMAGVFSASGDFQFLSSPITAFNLAPSGPVALAATFDAGGDPVSSAAGPCDPAAIWAHVLPNGLTAAETVTQIHTMLTALHQIHGLQIGMPLVVTPTSRTAGPIAQTIASTSTTTTVTRT